MSVYKKNKRAYGIVSPFVDVFNFPIVSKRAPTTRDTAEVGSIWVYQNDAGTDDVFILSRVSAGTSTWVSAGGGDPVFDSLEVENDVTINSGDLIVTAGGIDLVAGDLTLGAGDITVTGIAQANPSVALVSAAGVISTDIGSETAGNVLIGGSTGVAWSTLTAGAGINIVNADNSITISNPGATGTSMSTDVGGPVLPDGAGVTDVVGYDANISTDGATANTLRIRLADNITSVGKITSSASFEVTSGTTSITSNTNVGDDIFIHANGGVNEGIGIRSTQGTQSDAIYLTSVAGGVDINGGGALSDAVAIEATNAAGGVELRAGTAGIGCYITNGVFALETGTGDVQLGADSADHDIYIGDNTGSNALLVLSGTGHSTFTSSGATHIDSVGTVNINSSTDEINIGDDAVAQNINIGTGAAARTITVGNTSGASAVVVDCGTGGVSIGASANAHTTTVGSTNTTSGTVLQAGTGVLSIDGGGDFEFDAAGDIYINSSAGTINICDDAVAQNINIGTGAAARTITVGNITAASAVVVDCGTGGVSIGASATAHTTTVGSTNTTSAATIQSGTGAMTFTAGGIFDVNATGDVTIDTAGVVELNSTAGAIGIGNDADAQAINIGTGAAARTITIGNNTGATAVDIVAGTGSVSSNTDIEFLTATTGLIFQEGPKVIAGAGSPSAVVNAPKGSLYLRTDGTTTNDRIYVNTDGVTAWTSITTAS